MRKGHFKNHRPLYSNVLPPALEKPKFKWRLLPIIWLSLKRTAMALGFLMLINIVLALIVLPAFLSNQGAAPSLPDEMVLFLPLEDGLAEQPAPASFSDPFAGEEPTLKDIVRALDLAAGDKRVKGLVARMYDGSFSLTRSAELRAALKRFRASGKFAHIYSTSYGEGGGGLGRYYLASVFDEIWMQPLGVVAINGVQAEVPFFRETLDKIGVEPNFFKRKDFKTAYESVTDKGISPENRQTMEQIIGDIRREVLAVVPAERGMSPEAFEGLVDKGLFTAHEAWQAKLITHNDYGDVLLDNIAESVTGERDADKLELIDLDGYGRAIEHKGRGLMAAEQDKVALVYVAGAIMPSADGGGLSGGDVAAADEIAPAILEAAKDDNVRAIVLRVDSPGGSPSASESILRAVEKAQEKGKPVIVSMGTMAASGGYWVSAYADKIYAQPTTLTGSIGVVGGKFSLAGVFEKLGVNWVEIGWGKNAGLWSANSTFSKSEAKRYNIMLDNVYDNFVARVAKGRNMSPKDVEKIAGGRVWTGRRAVEVGLVDELGGLENALDHVASLTGAESRRDLNVVVYPKPKTPFEQIVEFLDGQGGLPGVKLQARALEVLTPTLNALDVMQNPQNYSVYEPLSLK